MPTVRPAYCILPIFLPELKSHIKIQKKIDRFKFRAADAFHDIHVFRDPQVSHVPRVF